MSSWPGVRCRGQAYPQARGLTPGAPAGGTFLRDEGGQLTGVVLDSAMELLLPLAVDIGCHGPNFHTDLPTERLLSWLTSAGETYRPQG